MRVLIIEAQSGISGDMFVAAAAHLAGCEQEVAELPARLGLAGVTCVFRDVVRGNLKCRKFVVQEDRQYSKTRPLAAIKEMIAAANLDGPVTERALRMFSRLGDVEAAVHDIPVDALHFHEIGAVDSIIDITAASLCIERLGIGAAFTTPVCVGSGTVNTEHGVLPVPAPATERLLRGMATMPGDLAGEWTTPTGALILNELAADPDIPVLVTTAATLGAGDRDPAKRPNMLRLRLAETGTEFTGRLDRDELMVIRCNIDDAAGEMLGAEFIDRLLQAGARDAFIAPVIMKKGRPGQVLEVLADPDRAAYLTDFILANTSSIGVRLNRVQRRMLPRDPCRVKTRFGMVEAKMVRLPDGRRRIKPEFESCRVLAAEKGVSVQEVYQEALKGIGD